MGCACSKEVVEEWNPDCEGVPNLSQHLGVQVQPKTFSMKKGWRGWQVFDETTNSSAGENSPIYTARTRWFYLTNTRTIKDKQSKRRLIVTKQVSWCIQKPFRMQGYMEGSPGSPLFTTQIVNRKSKRNKDDKKSTKANKNEPKAELVFAGNGKFVLDPWQRRSEVTWESFKDKSSTRAGTVLEEESGTRWKIICGPGFDPLILMCVQMTARAMKDMSDQESTKAGRYNV